MQIDVCAARNGILGALFLVGTIQMYREGSVQLNVAYESVFCVFKCGAVLLFATIYAFTFKPF